MTSVVVRCVAFGAAVLFVASVTPAAVLCRHTKSGRVTFREATCKKKEAPLDLTQFGAVGPQGLQGPQGVQGQDGTAGAPGADGQLRIYGDGSNGAWSFDTPGGIENPEDTQFTDLTINAPVSVSSGTIIRCTGHFAITGTGSLNVAAAAGGGFTFESQVDGDTLTYPYQPPHPGWSPRIPTNGEVTMSGAVAAGGIPGRPLGTLARWLLRPGIYGGGGGANSSLGAGGTGGGAILILVQGTFVNAGLLAADGTNGSGGSGGGGGGIIVVASRTSILNSGIIRARGGPSTNVASATAAVASGGGGGGGVVHLIAPAVTPGTTDVAGGVAGFAPASVSSARHFAGGGGGGCGGVGGAGGDVPAGNPTTPERGGDGAEGAVFVDQSDPTSLF